MNYLSRTISSKFYNRQTPPSILPSISSYTLIFIYSNILRSISIHYHVHLPHNHYPSIRRLSARHQLSRIRLVQHKQRELEHCPYQSQAATGSWPRRSPLGRGRYVVLHPFNDHMTDNTQSKLPALVANGDLSAPSSKAVLVATRTGPWS